MVVDPWGVSIGVVGMVGSGALLAYAVRHRVRLGVLLGVVLVMAFAVLVAIGI